MKLITINGGHLYLRPFVFKIVYNIINNESTINKNNLRLFMIKNNCHHLNFSNNKHLQKSHYLYILFFGINQ